MLINCCAALRCLVFKLADFITFLGFTPNFSDITCSVLYSGASTELPSFLTSLYCNPAMSIAASATVLFMAALPSLSMFSSLTTLFGFLASRSARFLLKSASSSCCMNASVSASIVASYVVVSPIGASRETVSRLPLSLYSFITSPLALYITD